MTAGVTPLELLLADSAVAALLGLVVGILWTMVQVVNGSGRGRHVRHGRD